MIIILGTKVRVIERSSGEFYCPNCSTRRPYKLKRYAKYFTLFFIPLFQIKNLGEQVECQKCLVSFKPRVLDRPTKPQTVPKQDGLKTGADFGRSRAPFQVLVLPYRQLDDSEYEYAVLRRADEGYWHVVAGGGIGRGFVVLDLARIRIGAVLVDCMGRVRRALRGRCVPPDLLPGSLGLAVDPVVSYIGHRHAL